MFRCEARYAGLLACANPDGSGAADEREGIVTDEVCRTFEREGDGIVSVGADGAELVGDAKDDAGGVGSVSAEEVVVRKESKFGVDAAAGKGFGDDLFSVDESVDAQIAPSCAVAAQIENEGRVFEMGELFAVCIGFRD